jgi:hypothetical protein
MNDGMRIALDLRGGNYWRTLTERGEQHESSRGYTTPIALSRAAGAPIPKFLSAEFSA